MIGPGRLRAITYLAPSIPLEFFELVSDHLAEQLSRDIELISESRNSGPMHGDTDPFAEGRADIGFLCSPSYLYLRALPRPSIELVPASFAFRDARAQGRPVYFSDVVVRADNPAQGFADLGGGVWGYNDECSLSGYFAALQKLSELGCENGLFGRRVQTGSHRASIEAALAGEIDGAAIDSTVLAMMRRECPKQVERLRVIESWGPFPVQPVVVRKELASQLGPRIADALLGLHRAGRAEQLSGLGLERCVPIEDAAYAEERRALYDLGLIPSETP